jgi:hypothetical protein
MGRVFIIQSVLSLIVIIGGTAIAINKESPEIRNPAMAAVGMVIGYWFRSPLDQENSSDIEKK